MTTIHIIKVCIDCAYISSNGTHGAEFPEGFVGAYLARCEETGKEPVIQSPGDDGEYDSHFSWNPCDFCGSKLAGDRYDAVLMHRRKEGGNS